MRRRREQKARTQLAVPKLLRAAEEAWSGQRYDESIVLLEQACALNTPPLPPIVDPALSQVCAAALGPGG